jgi:hypothetical protein
MSSCQGDCRCSSLRMDFAYSLQGLKSRPKEWRSTTLLGSAAAAPPQANNVVKAKSNHTKQQTPLSLENRQGFCTAPPKSAAGAPTSRLASNDHRVKRLRPPKEWKLRSITAYDAKPAIFSLMDVMASLAKDS